MQTVSQILMTLKTRNDRHEGITLNGDEVEALLGYIGLLSDRADIETRSEFMADIDRKMALKARLAAK